MVGIPSAAFAYDGDGNRVQSTVNGVSTVYVNSSYEVSGGVTTSYYFAEGQRIAMRKTGVVSYLLPDHLGSTMVTSGSSGVKTAEQWYKAWGEVRYSSGSLQTKYTYTGQYSNTSDFGLMYYNARWYDSAMGRFIQADTIVPQPGNSQAWDRYSYVLNSPINYTDPSGHKACSNDENSFDTCLDPLSATLDELGQLFGITFHENWSDRNKIVVIIAASNVGMMFSSQTGGSAREAFTNVFKDGIALTWGTKGAQPYCFVNGRFDGGGCTNSASSINFVRLVEETVSWGGYITVFDAFLSARNNVVHELGHAFASLWYHQGNYSPDGPYGTGQIPSNLLNELGFIKVAVPNQLTWRQHPGDTGQNEIFSDMFLGWTYGVWDYGVPMGYRRDEFMTTNMAEWISTIIK